MKALFLPVFLLVCIAASAQYYYKDIIGTRESSDMIRNYMKNKVSRVSLTSFNSTNMKDDNFLVEQKYNAGNRSLSTTTRSYLTDESMLISYVNESGNVIRTFDSSDEVVSVTNYDYDQSGNLVSVTSSSSDSAKTSTESEQHLWQWKDSRPVRMLRIKNGKDTTFVNFKLDASGNVTEETETHKGVTTQPVYYYYNANNQLSDIVRFSKRVNKLLPEYMFEYTESGQVSQKITVPSNSSEYLIWRYQYNSNGLRTKEVVYNKQKKLTGKIEYQYFF
jgi:YD repeat-containing protein